MSIDEVMTEVRKYDCPLVEITGGEPLLQKHEVYTLMEHLLSEGYDVLLETSGSLPVDRVPEAVIRIIDIKCPDSGESARVCWEILDHLRPTDEIKFVVASRHDYEWAREVIERYRLSSMVTVLMGVAFGCLEPVVLAEWILEDRLAVRMQLQIHKYLWDPLRRGI
jgi:7-carboxy-7-deazaguanine synthase